MFICVLGEEGWGWWRYSNVCLCVVEWGGGGGGIPIFAYVLGEGGQGRDKMWKLCVGMCVFLTAEFMDEVKVLYFLYWNVFCAELKCYT